MRAVIVRRGGDAPELVERPRPEPGPGEALVRTLRVGIDGTDHEVLGGGHGGFPPGEDHLVLGHEAVGRVADPNGTDLSTGDVVVPTVRRPPVDDKESFDYGEADMLPPEECVERGIDGAHGFMAEYFTSPARCLVPVPERLAPLGFLAEPLSISEKALAHANASRSAFDWRPESALVLGNGSLGLLTLAMLDEYDRTYCLGRRDRPDPSIDIVESLGATYVDSRETPVTSFAAVHEPVDLVYEATGYARHAFDPVHALAPGGVAALLGIPEPWTFEIDGGAIHREIVMNNKAIVGSVNSGYEHFEAAIDTLDGLDPGFVDDFLTGVYDASEAPAAFEADGIKTAVQFEAP